MTQWEIVAAIATPILAFVGALAGAMVQRRSAKELDTWRRREETMRLLRWALEQASSDRSTPASIGVLTLTELLRSDMLQAIDLPFVGAIADGVLATVPGTYDEDTQFVEET